MRSVVLLASLGAAALACAMPGLGLWPLAFVALVPWAVATERAVGRGSRFLADYAFGVVFFGARVLFLSRITWIAYVPVVLVAPLFIALSGLLYRRLRRSWPASLSLPLAWLAGEALRSVWPFLFPWDLLGYAAAGWLDLAGLASLGGPWIVTFLVASVNGAFVDLVRRTPRAAILAAATGVALALGALFGGFLRRDVGPLEPGPLFACVQPNFEQSLKEDLQPQFATVVERLLRNAKEGAEQGADVVVLPETMFPASVVRGAEPSAIVFPGLRAKDLQQDERQVLRVFRDVLGPRPWLLTGAILYDRESEASSRLRPRNSALLFDSRDRETARYDKLYLVPGAEALVFLPEGPLADAFRAALDPYTHGMIPELVPGSTASVFALPAGPTGVSARAGLAICYDNAFPGPFREAVARGANLHLVLSNEGWFPNSYEMDSMLAYSSFRAIETRRSVLRATNTGISCLIDPDGSIASVLLVEGRRSEVEGVFLARPKLGRAQTLYVQLGDAPAYGLTLLGVLAAAWAGRRRTGSAAPPSP